jgi:pimeloyl-ACP methyl ester carboxylesterase
MSGLRKIDIDWAGRQVAIEHQWLFEERVDQPLMVFLHEGLGSVAMWKDFPRQLCEAVGMRGLVYSRPGYGGSTPRAPDEHWQPDYMYRQATEVLPALLSVLGVAEPPWLFGHSDGASIALIHAGSPSNAVAGVVVAAPHIFVEEFGLASIRAAREAYLATKLREKLARYHEDVDSAFWGWNEIWLDPRFKAFDIRHLLPAIGCPVLAVQGLDDEYGTLEQIRGIARCVRQAELLEIAACGHSPHRDQPALLIEAVRVFCAATKGRPVVN